MSNKRLNLENQRLTIAAENDPDLRVMRGRFLYNAAESHSIFLEGLVSHKRSVELARTPHIRCVKRQSGIISVSLKFCPDEANIKENLTIEFNSLINTLNLN